MYPDRIPDTWSNSVKIRCENWATTDEYPSNAANTPNNYTGFRPVPVPEWNFPTFRPKKEPRCFLRYQCAWSGTECPP